MRLSKIMTLLLFDWHKKIIAKQFKNLDLISASTFRPNLSKYLTCFKILPPDLGPGIPVRDCLLPASWSVRDGQQVSQFCTWLKLHSSAYVTSEKKSLIGNKKLYELKKNMRLSKIMTLLLFDCTKKWLQSNLKTWMSAFHGERLIKKAISIKCTNYKMEEVKWLWSIKIKVKKCYTCLLKKMECKKVMIAW